MAYLIYGEERPVVFLANPRTGSTALAQTLMELGADRQQGHHGSPTYVPKDALVVHTVRHHCDVIVSYWYKAQGGTPLDKFVEIILSGQHYWFHPDVFYGRWDEVSPPNYILRYETLQFEWEVLCEVAGLPQTKLPRTETRRPKNIKWNMLFTPRLYDQVYSRYKDEMEKLGYGRN